MKTWAELTYSDFYVEYKPVKIKELPGYIERLSKNKFVVRNDFFVNHPNNVVNLSKKITKNYNNCRDIEIFPNEERMTEDEVIEYAIDVGCFLCRHAALFLKRHLTKLGFEVEIIYGFYLDKNLNPIPHAWIAYRGDEDRKYTPYDPFDKSPLIPVEIVNGYRVFMSELKKLEVTTIKGVRVRIL